MRAQTALLCAALALAAVWKLADANIGQISVTIQDGKCPYKNITMEDGESFYSEYPCQVWTCDVDESSVRILGCSPHPPLEDNCTEEPGSGVYPKCCPKIVCDGAEA